MHLNPVVAVVATAICVAYTINQLYQSWQHARKANELGCKAPARTMAFDPTGIAGLVKGAIASRQKRFPDFIEERFHELCEKYDRSVGTALIRAPLFRDILFTIDPQNIQTILALKFKEFGLGVNRTENFKPLLGNGIFAANGKQWEHSRALLRPQFARSQISDINLEETHVQSLLAVLDRHLQPDGWTQFVDLQPLFFRLTLDSATEFLFGESVNSQLIEGPDKPEAGEEFSFAYAFDRSQYVLSIAARLGGNYWLAHTPQFHRMVKRVHSFVDYFVQMALSQNEEKRNSADQGKYVFLHALAQETRDPNELRSQLLNILLAGRDTTASTLGWFFFTMADPQYQSVFTKLRGIVVDEFGSYQDPKDITFEKMKSCQYLQWCINECLRLYPVVSLNVRTAMTDTTLPTGGGPDGKSPIYVKKGQDVGYGVHIMHRRKDLWGEDADKFRPERWESRRPGWDYLPFNGGPRICIGQQFALTELAYVIIRLLQKIDGIDGSRVTQPARHNLTLTNCPADGVNVRLHLTK